MIIIGKLDFETTFIVKVTLIIAIRNNLFALFNLINKKIMESGYPIQQILERYDVRDTHLVYHLSEMESILRNSDFISVLLKMFEEEGYFPEEELNRFPLDVIIDYISRTHRYYLSKKLPEIEQSIELLLRDYYDNHPLLFLLQNFYAKYRNGLTHHIQDEEKILLPYVQWLMQESRGKCNTASFLLHFKKYSVGKSIETHSDTEGDLQEVRETIRQYNPPVTNLTPYRILLTQLQFLEKDLSVHAIIEDRILVPRAIKLEDTLTERLTLLTKLN